MVPASLELFAKACPPSLPLHGNSRTRSIPWAGERLAAAGCQRVIAGEHGTTSHCQQAPPAICQSDPCACLLAHAAAHVVARKRLMHSVNLRRWWEAPRGGLMGDTDKESSRKIPCAPCCPHPPACRADDDCAEALASDVCCHTLSSPVLTS